MKSKKNGPILRKFYKNLQRLKRIKPHLACVYRPAPPQMDFHKSFSNFKMIVFRAGNQSGKTFSSMADIAMHAMGIHPYIKDALPVKLRVIGLSTLELADPIWLTLSLFLPQSHISKISYYWKIPETPKMIILKNGSTIEFLSQEMKRARFQGWSGNRVHIDEEGRADVFEEIERGLLLRGGTWSMSYTPIIGQRWIKRIEKREGVKIIRASTYDNPAMVTERVDRWGDNLSEESQAYRIRGEFAQCEGLVYKGVTPETHGAWIRGDVVVDHRGRVLCGWPVPKQHNRYGGLDWGEVNPWTYGHYAKIRDDILLKMYTLYRSGLRPTVSANYVKRIWDIDQKPIKVLADHDAEDRAEYKAQGIYTKPANKALRRGIENMRDVLEVKQNGHPSLYVLMNGPKIYDLPSGGEPFFNESDAYKWPDNIPDGLRNAKEEPLDRNNHAMDETRYVLMYVFGSVDTSKPPKLDRESEPRGKGIRGKITGGAKFKM